MVMLVPRMRRGARLSIEGAARLAPAGRVVRACGPCRTPSLAGLGCRSVYVSRGEHFSQRLPSLRL